MLGLTPLGVVHTAISLVAVAAGFVALIRDREISLRNAVGKLYVVTTALTALTGLGIFQHGGFGKPHDVSRRELTLRSLKPGRRLALEMAVDEQAEVQELERQWRDAEELADISDGTLSTTSDLEEMMRRLKQSGRNQPPG